MNVFFGVYTDQNIYKQLQKAIKSPADQRLLLLCNEVYNGSHFSFQILSKNNL